METVVMKFMICTVILFAVAYAVTCSGVLKSDEMPKVEDSPVLKTEVFEEPEEKIIEPPEESDRDRMIEEVVLAWNIFLDDGYASKNDHRRKCLREYADYLVDTVVMYQKEPTDIGGQLPLHGDAHLIIANRVSKESSIYPDVVGKKGEVGLMQVMPGGPAIAGYDPQKVKDNPKLGLLLGIRWLASRIPKCKRTDALDLGWSEYDWLGPLTLYVAGPKAKRKDGTCKIYGSARKLVKKTLIYRTRIDYAKSQKQGDA